MENKITLKTALLALLDIPNQVKNQFSTEQHYQTLVEFITTFILEEEAYKLPTIKELENITGLKHYQLNKRLIEMYNVVCGDPKEFEYVLDRTLFYFTVKHDKTYAYFKCKNLHQIPRVGENITIPYLSAKFRYSTFYVDAVYHNFYDEVHTVDINLKCGLFNSFWKNRLDEAKFKNELPFMDFLNLSEYELKEKLGIK